MRPGLESFLNDMSQIFEIVIYTASISDYAEAIINQLSLSSYISRIFHRDHCKQRSDSAIIKDISVVDRDPQTMVMIDVSVT